MNNLNQRGEIIPSTAIAPAYVKAMPSASFAIAKTAQHYKVMVAFVQTQMVKNGAIRLA
jgi:hypothetical protein